MGIKTEGLVRADSRQTTVKIRIIGNNQQLLRIDKEQTNEIDDTMATNLVAAVTKLIEGSQIDALIFEDYNKGVLTAAVIEKLIALCNQNKVVTTVDPKKQNFLHYQGVTLFKPNFKELKEGLDLNFSFQKGNEFEHATQRLFELLQLRYLFVTLSEHGVYMLSNGEHAYIDAHRRAIRDVSGAGDTVIAVATLGLTAGMNGEQIAQIANVAGGLVCEKSGVVSINKIELLAELKRLGL
jgi:rfaE bifunctional protein kinase chain/domain